MFAYTPAKPSIAIVCTFANMLQRDCKKKMREKVTAKK